MRALRLRIYGFALTTKLRGSSLSCIPVPGLLRSSWQGKCFEVRGISPCSIRFNPCAWALAKKLAGETFPAQRFIPLLNPCAWALTKQLAGEGFPTRAPSRLCAVNVADDVCLACRDHGVTPGMKALRQKDFREPDVRPASQTLNPPSILP